MNGNGASQAGSANLFLSMMGMLQPITAEEAKEDTIDDEDKEEEIQDEDSNDYSSTFTMPTFQEKPTKRLNTRYLKSEDLETLKEEDLHVLLDSRGTKSRFCGKRCRLDHSGSGCQEAQCYFIRVC